MLLLRKWLKILMLPPVLWITLLVVVLVFWNKKWARRVLLAGVIVIALLHSTILAWAASYLLESRFPRLRDIRIAAPYDAIVVLTGGHATIHRVEEAWRLYRTLPKPIIVAGDGADPFTTVPSENKVACNYLALLGVPAAHIIPEANSRNTFESAIEVGKILQGKGWRRYLLVTSALHMPRSMLAFQKLAPTPVAAPGNFTVGRRTFGLAALLPSEWAASSTSDAFYEYLGLVNYRWRIRFHQAAP